MPKKKITPGQAHQADAPPIVTELVARFAEHYDAYRQGQYNETQLRREFLDPLFKALGWDVDNEQGYAQAYKDVIHEDAIKVGGATKAPDYCFRIGGVRKFFLEAKKPSVDIKGDPAPAYQLRRYAWSAKLPLSILSDFEEVAVYDCRIKPAKDDKPTVARVMYFTFEQLPQRWAEFAGIFAREAILKGSFDKYADSAKRKRGTAEVDDAFLQEIEHWRDALARNLALRNENLSQRDLNFAVQRTIDRIIFLRICEDRAVEPYGTLMGLINGEQTYARLFERFRRADERYNSGLFHFTKEKARPETPDDLTPNLVIDDKTLKDILKRLYYPESPYEFSVLPADILGQVYEQFLGKVIRLTKGHRAVVEEKPEVRKAGGVYYTPTHIVDYIVKHTVGKLVEGKTPKQIGALTDTFQVSKAKGVRPTTVLDPACGSGSFLLGAYQFLLDWYRDRYLEDGPENHTTGKNPRLYQRQSSPQPAPPGRRQSPLEPSPLGRGQGENLSSASYASAGGEYRLTTTERKRILTSHIFGVDIDPQAVETTKLSLLLKVLEGESAENLDAGLRLFHERALPDLADNIKCGNSLIGPDFYTSGDNQQANMFDEDERLRINVFDWKPEFKEIMKNGGFGAVIGNPPWGSKLVLSESEVAYLTRSFDRPSHNMNIFAVFIDQVCHHLLCDSGRMGFLIPKNFIKTNAYLPYRRDVLTKMAVDLVTDFGQFPQVAQECVGLFVSNNSPLAGIKRVDHTVPEPVSLPDLSLDSILNDPFAVVSLVGGTDPSTIIRKIRESSHPLGDDCNILRGLEHGRNGSLLYCGKCRRYFEKPGKQHSSRATAQCRWCHAPIRMDDRTANHTFIHAERPGEKSAGLLVGNSIDRYQLKQIPFHAELALHGVDYKSLDKMAEKLLFIRIAQTLRGYLDTEGLLCLNALNVITPKPDSDYNIRYILGLLNSRAMALFADFAITAGAKLTIRFSNELMRSLPIRTINFDDAAEKAKHDRMVALVQSMLDLHKQLAGAKTSHAKTAIQRQIDATDRQIDQLVYELYGLTDEEVAVVEESIRR